MTTQATFMRGTGLAMQPEFVQCPECHGLGFVAVPIIEKDGSLWYGSEDCMTCRGHGRLLRDGTPLPRKSDAPRLTPRGV